MVNTNFRSEGLPVNRGEREARVEKEGHPTADKGRMSYTMRCILLVI